MRCFKSSLHRHPRRTSRECENLLFAVREIDNVISLFLPFQHPSSTVQMTPVAMSRILLAVLALVFTSQAATTADWRSRSIYQILTDRFARSDGSTTSRCDPVKGTYCGGSYQGIINNLDYIQGMGFTAVSQTFTLGISFLSFSNTDRLITDVNRSGYRLSHISCSSLHQKVRPIMGIGSKTCMSSMRTSGLRPI